MVTDTGPNGRLELTLTDDVAELRATAPEQRNCVSLGFVDDLFAHIDTLEARLSDGDVSAILLTHAGDVFCAGYDLDIISDEDRADERETLIERHNAG